MSLGTLLERLFVSIQADMSGLTDEMDKAARDVRTRTEDISKRFLKMGTTMKKVGKSASIGVTLPLIAIGKSAISAASDVEEMQSKFDVVFGSLAGDVAEWSSTTARELNRSKFDLMEYAASFQDTFVPMGFARDQAADLSKQITQLGVDLASFNNIAESEAMAALQSAIVGNHETMRRFGVIITAATLDAELLRMGIEGGSKAASEQEKIMARLNMIMAGTSDAQGDAARTSDGFANQMRGLQAALKEVAAVMGQIMMPVVQQLVTWFTDLAAQFLALDPATQTFIVKVLALTAVIGPLLLALGTMMHVLAPIAAALIALVSPAGLVVAGVAALTVAIWANWDAIKEWTTSLVDGTLVMMASVIQFTTDTIASIVQWAVDFKESVARAVDGAIEALFGFKDRAADVIAEAWTTIVETITGWYSKMYDMGAALIEQFISGAMSMIPGIAAVQDKAAQGLADKLKDQFGTGSGSTELDPNVSPDDLYNLYGIESPKDRGFQQGSEFGQGVEEGIKDALEINSPSKVMYGVGEEVMAGLRNALENSEASLRDLSNGLADQIAEPILKRGDEMSREFSGVTQTMKSHLDTFIKTGKFKLGEFAADITGGWLQTAVGNFSDQITKIIMEAFTGLAGSISGGIGGSGGGLFSALGSLFNGLFGGFRATGGVVPPWKSFVAGERGAEMIEQDGPAGARRVSTAGRTASMSGGRVHVTVSGARGNAEIRDMVSQGVREGLGTYDRSVGSRVKNNLGRRE